MENNKLQILIQDLKTAKEIEDKIGKLQTLKMDSPIQQLIERAIDYRILKNTSDLFKLVKEFPNLEERIIHIYDNYLYKKNEAREKYLKQEAIRNSKYSGTYDKLSDAPGYGTEWNERCVPDGVYVRSGIGRDC